MMHNNSPRMGMPIKSQTPGCVGPTTYILCDGREKLPNRVPFLSTEKKEPSFFGSSFCDTLYNVHDDHTILGGTSPRYKTPRFTKAEDSPIGPGYYDQDPLKEVRSKSCRAGKGKLYLCPVPYTWSGDVQPRPPKRRERHVGPMTYRTEKKLYYGYYYGEGNRWSASRTRRKFYDVQDTPGPADYQVKHVKCLREQKDEEFREMARLLTYIPRYLDAQEMKAKSENLPGPGHYNVRNTDMCHRCDSINPRPFITAKKRLADSGDNGTPSPGRYNIVEVKYPVSKKFVPFSVQSERFPRKASATAPGPGEYMLKGSVQEALDSKKNWYMDVEPPFSTTATRNTLAISKYTLSIPSAAEYTINLEKRCKLKVSSPFKSKTQRFPRPRNVIDASPARYDTTPAYHALTNQKFHNVYEVPFNNFANPRTRGILDPMYVNYDNPDRQNKSYSFAWVNGVSVRSNFTQTILDHEKSQQHISASLSYNNWLQENTIDTLLKSEIDSKITFWRDVLHRIINVIITLVSCNLPLRGHDSESGNFMAISRLLSNYDATLKELLLKPKGEINYLSPTIQNEIISLLGTTVRNNIISEIKKAPFLTIILDTTQDLSKIDQLSVVFRYISVTENDDNVPKEIKICESFLGFIAVTDCSAAAQAYSTFQIHPVYDRSIYKAFTTQNIKLKEDVLKQKIKKHTNETYKKWATNLSKPKKMRWFVENDMKQNYFM
nr:unnamed protein product [Callosobruchus analis]